MSPGRRLGAALAGSLALHALLLLLVQMPARPLGAVSEALHVLLVPLQPPSPPVPEASPAPVPEAKPAPESTPRAPRARPARKPAAAPVPAPVPELRPPAVTASLVSKPPYVPQSRLADASGYHPAEGLTRAPRLAGELAVRYPLPAFEARRQGEVVLQVMIDERGRVVEALAVPSAPEEFVEAALAGVRRTRFEPGELGGRAVPVRAYLAVHFVIE